MNPLFLAHLLGDFLLQPTALVRWKQKKMAGVVVHALIHTALLWLVVMPPEVRSAAIILGIGLSHGIIDRLKIRWAQPKAFYKGFLLDQLAHFTVLAGASFLFPFYRTTLNSESFMGSMLLLVFFAFCLGGWNIAKAQPRRKAVVPALALVFAIFTLGGSLLFSALTCSEL